MEEQPNSPPPGYVWLGLSVAEIVANGFHLEIPVSLIGANCRHPIKYLRYLAWCIVFREGSILRDNETVEDYDEIVDRGEYRFKPGDEDDWYKHLVDPEVIRQRSNTHSARTDELVAFDVALFDRDQACVFTNQYSKLCHGVHIIPYARGAEWLDEIVCTRLQDAARRSQPSDIDDTRNGFLLGAQFHMVFDARELVVLKTPNRILTVNDIPKLEPRTVKPTCTSRNDLRFSAQWLTDDPELKLSLANNTDAAFKKHSDKESLPSDLLLHYNYGAAAVKMWGRQLEALYALVKFPRPSQVPTPSGPAFRPRDSQVRQQLATKRDQTTIAGQAARDAQGGEEEAFDEEDVLLMFAASTPAARARRESSDKERTELVHQWMRNVGQSSGEV